MKEYKTDREWVLLQEGPIELEPIVQFVQVPEAGAIDLFVGTTRRWTDGRETVDLYYEAFEEMAVKEIAGLFAETSRKWPVARQVVVHRLGRVAVGEASVVIAVSSAHRNEAFQACRFLIDELKKRVPIWKKERYADDETEWVEGTLPPIPES
jgi:molybdopterin synthase catalytic subunit